MPKPCPPANASPLSLSRTRLQRGRWLHLAHRQEAYLTRVSPGACGRSGHTFADLREVPGYVVQGLVLTGVWKPSYAK